MSLKFFTTLGPLGFLSGGGSWASFITLLIAYAFGFFNISSVHQISIISCLLIIAWYTIHTTRIRFGGRKDPAEIVIDESVGMLITVIGLPTTVWYIVASFAMFRALDIYKPWPIASLERLPYTWGILLDDCAAGICACAILHIIYYFF